MLGTLFYFVFFALVMILEERASRVDALSMVKSKRPKALYFSGAGTYVFWQCGAAKYLQEGCAYSETPIVGASAGSLTGLLLLAGVDMDEAMNVALQQAEERRIFDKKGGLRGELKSLLEEWMEIVILDYLPREVLSSLSIALTPPPFNPLRLEPPKLMQDFVNREDVISACVASCHIPFFSSGTLTAEYKGSPYIDGSFYYWVTKNRFSGLPLPDCNPEDVFWIDYCDDEAFMERIRNKSFLDVHEPRDVRDMFDAGYKYLENSHNEGKLPLAINPKLLNVPSESVIESTKPRVSRLEKELRQWRRDNDVLCGRVSIPNMAIHQAGLSGTMTDATFWPTADPHENQD